MLVRPCHQSRARCDIGARLAMVLLAIGLFAVITVGKLNAQAPATMYSMVPKSAVAFTVVDAQWLWKSITYYGKYPEFGDALRKMDDEFGFSVEKDIIPWAGDVAIMLLPDDKKTPRGLALVQIKDPVAFLASGLKLKNAITAKSKLTWTTTKYQDIELQQATLQQQQLTTGLYQNWLIFGIGENVVQNAIDVWMGKSPNVLDDARWKQAFTRLPAMPHFFVSANMGDIMSMIPQGAANPVGMTGFTEYTKYTTLMTLTETDRGNRLSQVTYTDSAKLQQLWKEIGAELTPVTGDVLAQLPDGTCAAILFSSPEVFWKLYTKVLPEMMPSEEAKGTMTMVMAAATPFAQALSAMKDNSVIAVHYSEKKGFGVSLFGKATDEPAANDAAAQLSNAFTKLGAPVVKSSVYFKIGETPLVDNPMFQLHPCWTTQGPWMKLTTNKQWTFTGKAPLVLPEEARGSQMVFVLNTQPLVPLLQKAMGSLSADQNAQALLQDAHLDTLQIVAASRIDADGQCTVSTLDINNGNVVALSAAMLYPVFVKARQQALRVTSMSNLRQLATAVSLYAQDHNETLPQLTSAKDLQTALGDLIGSDSIFLHPASKKPYVVNTRLSKRTLASIAHPELVIIFYDPVPDAAGFRCAAFVDGHVEYLSPEAWTKMKSKSGIP